MPPLREDGAGASIPAALGMPVRVEELMNDDAWTTSPVLDLIQESGHIVQMWATDAGLHLLFADGHSTVIRSSDLPSAERPDFSRRVRFKWWLMRTIERWL